MLLKIGGWIIYMELGECQLYLWVLALSVISVVLDKCLKPTRVNVALVIFLL